MRFGSEYQFRATHSGELHVILNQDGGQKADNTGSVTIIIEEQP